MMVTVGNKKVQIQAGDEITCGGCEYETAVYWDVDGLYVDCECGNFGYIA